jgi:hypothetical protein
MDRVSVHPCMQLERAGSEISNRWSRSSMYSSRFCRRQIAQDRVILQSIARVASIDGIDCCPGGLDGTRRLKQSSRRFGRPFGLSEYHFTRILFRSVYDH